MAILDANLVLSNAQAITVDAISENVIRVPEAGVVPLESAQMSQQWGAGVPLPMLVQVVTTFAGLTSLAVTLETSNNADLSSATVMARSAVILAADLVAGKNIGLDYFPDVPLQDYVGLRYDVTGTATAGAITAAVGSTKDAGHV